MRPYDVRFTEAAIDDLAAIFDHVAHRAGARIARGFVDRLRTACLSLETAPHRGTKRDDLRLGLRTFGVERRATILFTIDEASQHAVILGVYYGGHDWGG